MNMVVEAIFEGGKFVDGGAWIQIGIGMFKLFLESRESGGGDGGEFADF